LRPRKTNEGKQNTILAYGLEGTGNKIEGLRTLSSNSNSEEPCRNNNRAGKEATDECKEPNNVRKQIRDITYLWNFKHSMIHLTSSCENTNYNGKVEFKATNYFG
jgi:hypothetical protein